MVAKADVQVEREGAVVIARVTGEVDLTNAPDVLDALMALVTNDCAGLVADLSDARYLDSTGVGVFFDATRNLHGRGQQIAIVCPPTVPLRRLLAITGIDSVVPIADRCDEAVTAIAATRS